MIDNNFNMTPDGGMNVDKYVNVINQLQDKSMDENILSCFMQQSASYLDVAWNDSKFQLLCSGE